MKFTIIWTKQALDDLASIWMSTSNKTERHNITYAADKIDVFFNGSDATKRERREFKDISPAN